MILKEENDRMYFAYLVCVRHMERMQFAYSNIQHLFPMTTSTFETLPDETLSFFERNKLTHEYPFDSDDQVEALNQLHSNYQLLISVWEFTETFLKQRFGYLFH